MAVKFEAEALFKVISPTAKPVTDSLKVNVVVNPPLIGSAAVLVIVIVGTVTSAVILN